MTAPQWLLQSNHPNLGAISEIAAILQGLGKSVQRVALKGHSTEMPDLGGVDPSLPVICYGPSFVPRAYRHPGLEPGIFFDPDLFRYVAFQRGWDELMLSRDAVVVDVEAASRQITRLGKAFVRPDEDSKSFDGGVHDAASFDAIVGTLRAKDLLPLAVIVAPAVKIEAEWRTFVVDGDVVAASSYRVDGKANIDAYVPPEVIDLAFEAAGRWQPDTVFCLDVARSEGRYGVIEANCFNASRFYGANAETILAAVSRSVEARVGLGGEPGGR